MMQRPGWSQQHWVTEFTRLLDDKVAQSDAFTYNGTVGGAAWKERVADYMI